MTPTRFPRDLLKRLPKSDLHVHLDGSVRLETLIELARDAGVVLPSETPEGLRELVFRDRYDDLTQYLAGFAYTCKALRTEEALERAAFELGEDCLAEGVRYIEVRFAPQLHLRRGLGVPQVIAAVDRGLARAQREHLVKPDVASGREPEFHYGIVACAMRMFTPGFSRYHEALFAVLDEWSENDVYGIASLSLARAVVAARDRHGLPIVGFDLAGAEAGHPASHHVEAFQYAHKAFLKKTVHAGEAYGPESIFQAITHLHADRIGHGTHLYAVDQVEAPDPKRYVRQLAEFISDRRITLEVCITSNLQTMPDLTRVEDHPFGRMMKDRLSVSLCTDNRLVSNTTVTQEIAQAVEAFGLSADDLRNVIIYGFKRSFFAGTYAAKRAYVRQIIDYYDEVMTGASAPSATAQADLP